MKLIRFMGDTHGKPILQKQNMSGVSRSIHVGDMGIGFDGTVDENLLKLYQETDGRHRFIRGNHDNLSLIKDKFSDYWIPDGTYKPDDDMFLVGGAYSKNKYSLKEGVTWWPDEELSEEEFDKILFKYAYYKPSIVVSHDLPSEAAFKMYDNYDPVVSVTSTYLSKMLEVHQPKLWVAGHWHRKRIREIYGTTFVVCPMDSFYDIDISHFNGKPYD